MVYGSPYQLNENEKKLFRYQTAKSLFKMTAHLQPINGTDNIIVYPPSGANPVIMSRTCLKLVDYIYCHWYFPQYRISSAHQSVCREECERIYSHVCKEEFHVVEEFNKLEKPDYPYSWDIINCTQLPWRNASRTEKVESGCYYYDNVRGKTSTRKQKTQTRMQRKEYTDRELRCQSGLVESAVLW